MGCALQQLGWFSDPQEMRFQPANRWIMGSAMLQVCRLLMFWIRVFTMWNVQIRQCTPAMRSVNYFSENAFSLCETFKYEQCHPSRRSISWCSGIAFSWCETFKLEECPPAIKLISWFSGIAFSGNETVRYGQRYPARGAIADVQE